jgi:hypothetical protein
VAVVAAAAISAVVAAAVKSSLEQNRISRVPTPWWLVPAATVVFGNMPQMVEMEVPVRPLSSLM